MKTTAVLRVEEYVKDSMRGLAHHHGFSHIDRVRNWAIQIARGEGFIDIEIVEIAALLHDIGLPHVKERSRHGKAGSEIAARFLRENNLLAEEKIKAISEAIEFHSTIEKGRGKLLDILRDADKIDALGAVGIMRAFTSHPEWPDYAPDDIKGSLWGKTGSKYKGVYLEVHEGKNTIIDQINLQIHYFDNMATATARKIARPFVAYMKNYVLQLEKEITFGRSGV